MTTWKQKNLIDWKEMASSDLYMLPKGATVNGLLLMNTTLVLL